MHKLEFGSRFPDYVETTEAHLSHDEFMEALEEYRERGPFDTNEHSIVKSIFVNKAHKVITTDEYNR